MYIFKNNELNVLCWCGYIWASEDNGEKAECPRCKRKASYENCIFVNEDEWKKLISFDELRNCHDCCAKPGENHKPGCDTEICPTNGGQEMCCGCCDDLDENEWIPWDGEWPGSKECRLHDLYTRTRTGDDPHGNYWIKCDRNHPDAMLDMNSLHVLLQWDKNKKHRVLRAGGKNGD